jgi:hypothetical protein
VKAWPAIVSVVDRAPSLFAATANETVPSPVPDDADVNFTHDAPLVALHVHPTAGPVPVTDTVPVPPLLVKDWLVGEIVANEHEDAPEGVGEAAWSIATVCPAAVTAPDRATPAFAAIAS